MMPAWGWPVPGPPAPRPVPGHSTSPAAPRSPPATSRPAPPPRTPTAHSSPATPPPRPNSLIPSGAAHPQSTRNSMTARHLHDAEPHSRHLTPAYGTCRGAFGHDTGVLRNGGNMALGRLRYGGSARSFGFAMDSAARVRYQDASLRT